jgi:antitoxin component of MazEF toxin-antitoxin module
MKKINVRGPGRLKKVMVRKLRQIGNSLYLPFPKALCVEYKFRLGDEMVIIHGGEIRITPVKKGEWQDVGSE